MFKTKPVSEINQLIELIHKTLKVNFGGYKSY